MSNWLKESASASTAQQLPSIDMSVDRKLRIMDIALALAALLICALPLTVGFIVGRSRSEAFLTGNGTPFHRKYLDFSGGLLGRLLVRLKFTHLPVIFNILRGEMAWVGPNPVSVHVDSNDASATSNPATGLRPGLVSAVDIRQQTAVHTHSEEEVLAEYITKRSVRHDLGILSRVMLLAWLPGKNAALVPARIGVGDVEFDNLNMDEALAKVTEMLNGTGAQQISFVNAACVNIAANNRGYRRILARAALVLPDGIGIKIAANLTGKKLKQNVNGTDFFPRLCAMMEARGASLYLIGGQPGIAERVAEVATAHWPKLKIAGLRDGFFSLSEEGDVVAKVRASQADVLLVARGVPMQDEFIDRHLHHLGVKAAMGVGGLFDFVSGRIARAPSWMRETGLEWVYRLMQEPLRMWKRYLVGNFSFLARVFLQHHGFRKPADDILGPQQIEVEGEASPEGSLRTFIFATSAADKSIPVSPNYPAALLPLGTSTFIEQCFDSLVHAGVAEVNLVVSAQPEDFRKLVGDGERWGLRLRWHLAKDMSTPYAILRALKLQENDRVLIGHADTLIPFDAIISLAQSNQTVSGMDDTDSIHWLGWTSLSSKAVGEVEPHWMQSELGKFLCEKSTSLQTLETGHLLSAKGSKELMAAQARRLTEESMNDVPATWLRASWGAYSPEAIIQQGAQITGPCLIGPGCFVANGAQILGNTVLSKDVIVSADTVITSSLVLPQSFIGSGMDLDTTIVNGGSVEHIRLGARTNLPASDGLMMGMETRKARSGGLVGRAVAAAFIGILSPLALVDLLIRKVAGKPARWTSQSIVTGYSGAENRLETIKLRIPGAPGGKLSQLLNSVGVWVDILTGKRAWFGARPRNKSEWYALGQDWQQLLSGVPIGYFHAPAWADEEGADVEASAAADVFFAVQEGLIDRTRLAAMSIIAKIKG